MRTDGMSSIRLRPRLSLNTLLLAVLICGLLANHFRPYLKPTVTEACLSAEEKNLIAKLRGQGLSFEQYHLCGMGDLATFEIAKKSEGECYASKIYLQHRSPVPLIKTILKFQDLEELQIGCTYSPVSLTIHNPACKDAEEIVLLIQDLLEHFAAWKNRQAAALRYDY